MAKRTQVMPVKDGINLLETTLNIHLSDEQKAILRYNYHSPVLVNSCAGAGKTTLLILSILLRIITNRNKPSSIMGITFSRKARLNMQVKYKEFLDRFQNLGINVKHIEVPYFTTFHALFFHLLLRIEPNIKVLSSYHKIMYLLMRNLPYQPNAKSTAETIDDIFQLRSCLINFEYTWDGVNARMENTNMRTLHQVLKDFQYTKKQITNYFVLVHTYNHYKQTHHYIDFNDMKILLYKDMGNSKKEAIIKKATQQYCLCLIDEFQDIDPIQWRLIRLIMPKTVIKHIGVFGDDDQSIYSFRGSDPRIILNFQKNVKHTKKFNLTTNYRTAGNILHDVKPVIESNQYRLGKPLNASHKNQGRLICFHHSQYSTGSALLFQNLMKKLQDPRIPNHKIAILTRFNLDKTLAIDQLANHGKFTRISKNNILQNNATYRIYVGLMYALYNDNFREFKRYARRIGFGSYLRHIRTVLFACKTPTFSNLNEYLVKSNLFDQTYRKSLLKAPKGYFSIKNDEKVSNAFVEAQALRPSTMSDDEINDNRTSLLFDIVDDLTSKYFKYMLDKNYINKHPHHLIKQYLGYLVNLENDPDKFFKNEVKKQKVLEFSDPNVLDKVNILTIHQAKGLQFDYVYVYNFRRKSYESDDVSTLDKLCPPNMTQLQFGLMLIKHSQAFNHTNGECHIIYNLSSKLHNIVKNQYRFFKHDESKKSSKKHRQKAEQKFVRQASHDLISQIIHHNFANGKDVESQHIQNDFFSDYYRAINLTAFIEEERRLVYVGFTRAKKEAYFNADKYLTPIMYELHLRPSNVLTLDKNGNVLTYHELLKQEGLSDKRLHQVQAIFKQYQKDNK